MREVLAEVNGETCVGWFTDTPEDLGAFRDWVDDRARCGDRAAVDSETTGLDVFTPGFRLRLAQFGTAESGWLIPVEYGAPFADAVRYALRRLPRMVAQNFPYDALVFDKHLGVTLEETMPKTLDTRILAHLIDSRPEEEGGIGLSLKPLAAHYVDPNAEDGQKALMAEFHRIGKTKATGWAHIDITHPDYLRYALLDVLLDSRLLVELQQRCRDEGVSARLAEYEHEIAFIGAFLERKGMRLDREYTEGLVSTLAEEEAEHKARALRYGVKSVNSPKQVGEALQGMGETLTERTESGALSVGKSVLLPLADLDDRWNRIGAREPNPLADAVLHAKRAGKWSTSYAQSMLRLADENGRVHPSVNTLGARTARWSMSNPPLQQLPSRGWQIRRCILADQDDHHIVASDLAQVELRVLVALAGATRIVERVNAGEDLHNLTTRMVYDLGPEISDDEIKDDPRRKLCKVISLGKAYAGGVVTLSKQTGLPPEQVKRALAKYDAALPEIKRYGARLQREAYANRMTVETPSGRVLRLNRDKVYTAIAFQCQSSARDILGQGLIEMKSRGLLPHLIGVVHDEVLASGPQAEAKDLATELGECMRMPFYGVNIESDPAVYGPTWGHGYGYKEAA